MLFVPLIDTHHRGSILFHLVPRIFSLLALRRAIAFTSSVEKPWHRSLEMYSRRLVLRHRIPDRHESTLRIMVHAEERTDRFGRSISEKFRVPFVRESYKWPYFDKDRSNVICNASSVLASRDIGLEKRGKKNLKRIRFRYKKKRC